MEQHNHFFAAHKDVNRYAVGQGMLFKLINEEKVPVSEEDTKNHKPIWIRKSEMSSWLNLAAFRLMWDSYLSGSDYFIGDGKMMNSGKFNDKDSSSVKKDITTSVGGQWVTKYKLATGFSLASDTGASRYRSFIAINAELWPCRRKICR